MYSIREMNELRTRNHWRIRELKRISYIIGINLNAQTKCNRWWKIINILFIIASCIALYPHWLMIQQAQGDIPLIAETSTTALQTTTGLIKMAYMLFTQHRFHKLLRKAETHELLQGIEIFQTGMPIKSTLKKEINAIMEISWKQARGQLLFTLATCICIMSNYFFYAFFKNLYNHLQGTPNYVYILPFTGYPMFLHKGMASPYYAMDMFFGACSILVAGMSAISFQGSFLVLCKHSCGLIQVLCLLLEKCTSTLVPKSQRVEYLRYCIVQHQRTLEFIDQVNQLFRHICLSQFLHSLAIYGFVLFEMNFGLESNKITFIRMLMYLCAATTGDCMHYVNGQFLANELEKIPLACYNCEWYHQTDAFKKTLRMIIMRSNKKFCFQISWFTVMSLATLMGIFKASGSYFVLLRDIDET
ncbi:odorant receptor 63a-like isoform X2 [Bactrocera neohumeralis]|uniref:odorant receptor 63a-like isoform X2 n=1 Tax=Bactrocera neohumeralis TaxID=98809 RepID=UPI0021650340|nr:odorant receptor 63a-like isoform X2 [Bactrocera neohumeralis]